MRCFTFIFIILLLVKNQDLEGYYVNDDNEVLIVDSKSISYRIKNPGGLISYSYFSGDYEKKLNKYFLKEDTLNYVNVHRGKSENLKENQILLCFYDNDENPLIYVPIEINETKDLKINKFITDSLGCLTLEFDRENLSPELNGQIQQLGNFCNFTVTLFNENSFKIFLKATTDFGIHNSAQMKRKYLKLKKTIDNHLLLYDPISKNWKTFTKNETNNYLSSDILF